MSPSSKVLPKRQALFEKPKNIGDVPLLVCTAGMAAFGCVMVYSASSYVGEVLYDDAFFFVTKQLVGGAIGLLAMVAAAFVPYKKLAALKYPLAALAAVLLALVFVPGIGVTTFGATRWLGLGALTI